MMKKIILGGVVFLLAFSFNSVADDSKLEEDDAKIYELLRKTKSIEEAQALLNAIGNSQKNQNNARVQVTRQNVQSPSLKDFMAKHKIGSFEKPKGIIQIGQTPSWVRKIGEPAKQNGAVSYRRISVRSCRRH